MAGQVVGCLDPSHIFICFHVILMKSLFFVFSKLLVIQRDSRNLSSLGCFILLRGLCMYVSG